MGIYQHFRTEEHPFIDQVISWKNNVEKMYQHRLTDFLDPREQQIVQSIIGTTNDELQLKFHGGGKFTESDFEEDKLRVTPHNLQDVVKMISKGFKYNFFTDMAEER